LPSHRANGRLSVAADYTKLPDVKHFSQPHIRRAVDPSAYLIDPEDAEVRMWRNRVRDYVESDAFKVGVWLGAGWLAAL
jgi:hypothetical protein